MEHPEVKELYEQSISTSEKYIRLCASLNVNPNLEDTIIFFDEIRENEELISALKWYCEVNMPFKIICAGSLLGVKHKRFDSSFPVGKVVMIDMYPIDFEEFLYAQTIGEYLVNMIKECYEKNKPMDSVLHDKLNNLYRGCLCI